MAEQHASVCGTVPPLAEPYFPRPETGPGLALFRPGQVFALTSPATGSSGAGGVAGGPAGGVAGTGKTQLAVEFARTVWRQGTVDLLVWLTAASREAIVAGLAQAAVVAGAADPDEPAEDAAEAAIRWFGHTRQPWALVIDGLASAADLRGLWPAGPAGQVVITSRLGRREFGSDVTVSEIGGFSRREALDYLHGRLTANPDQRIEALDLAEDLSGLPLALGQAVAVLLGRDLECRQYRAMFAERRSHMVSRPVPGVSAEVLATWSLAVEYAHAMSPGEAGWPTLVLAATLGSHGIPGSVLSTPAATGYITGRPAEPSADQSVVLAALAALSRASLISVDPASAVRTVWLHPSVRNAVRAFIAPVEREQILLASADALDQAWPAQATDKKGAEPALQQALQQPALQPALQQALRDCAASVLGQDQELLWKPDAHPLLFKVGHSLNAGGLANAAIGYWQAMAAKSTRLLGPGHADAVAAQDQLAAACESAGRETEAVTMFAAALADRERHLGAEHPDTIAARVRLAGAYLRSGKSADAVAIYERTVSDAERALGHVHPQTLAARAGLAVAYAGNGRHRHAIRVCRTQVTETERLLGTAHAATLSAMIGLGDAYQDADQSKDAAEAYLRALAAHQTAFGDGHPEVIAVRSMLASALRKAGKFKEALVHYERVLRDRQRSQGADHPDTIAARANLAFAYRTGGQMREALAMYEQVAADRERVQGSDHRDTRGARTNLASALLAAGHADDSIVWYERVVADSERILGPGAAETLTDRCNLAAAMFTSGRLVEAVSVLRHALGDCERYLPADHPLAQTIRDNLAAVTGG